MVPVTNHSVDIQCNQLTLIRSLLRSRCSLTTVRDIAKTISVALLLYPGSSLASRNSFIHSISIAPLQVHYFESTNEPSRIEVC